jgi:hypothetical protein
LQPKCNRSAKNVLRQKLIARTGERREQWGIRL